MTVSVSMVGFCFLSLETLQSQHSRVSRSRQSHSTHPSHHGTATGTARHRTGHAAPRIRTAQGTHRPPSSSRRGGDTLETRRRSYVMHDLCVCVILKEAPRARAQYARACEANTWALAAPTASASAPTGQPGDGGGQALLLLALGVAGGHGGQAGCLQPLQRVRHAAQLRVALLGREGRCAESPAIATRKFKGEYASCQRVGRSSSPRGVSCMATPNSARRARVGHSACIVRALAIGRATQAARMHSGRESPGKKS